MKQTVDLQSLLEWLQRGELQEIASEVGITDRQGRNIRNGLCQNWLYVEKFMERVNRNKALKEQCES